MIENVRTWFRRAWIVLLVAAVVIGLDQWTKAWVRATIPNLGDTLFIPGLGEYFLFEHVHNYGAAFGILQSFGGFFVVVAVIVTIAILIYVWHIPPTQTLIRFLLGLQLGGALGNAIDRLHQGYVTDFVKMGIPDVYYWPNYNIADSAIVCGVIGLGIYIIVDDVRRQRAERSEQVDLGADSSPASSSDAP